MTAPQGRQAEHNPPSIELDGGIIIFQSLKLVAIDNIVSALHPTAYGNQVFIRKLSKISLQAPEH